MLLPAAKPQVEGSAAPVAIPGCQELPVPVDTVTVGPHCVIPLVGSFLYTGYSTVAEPPDGPSSVRPITDVLPEEKSLNVSGS